MSPSIRSRTAAFTAAFLALAAVAAATPASAQLVPGAVPPEGRSGWAVTAALGAGNAGLSCPSCGDLDRVTGPAASLTIARAISPYVRLGVDFTGWSEDMGWAKKTLGAYTVVVQLYPSLTHAPWLRVGAGHAKLSVREVGAFEQSGTALTFAAGYDVRLGERVAILPFAQYLHQFPSDATGSAAHEGKGRASLIQFGVGVTYGR